MVLKCGLILAFFYKRNGSIDSFLNPKWRFPEKKSGNPGEDWENVKAEGFNFPPSTFLVLRAKQTIAKTFLDGVSDFFSIKQ